MRRHRERQLGFLFPRLVAIAVGHARQDRLAIEQANRQRSILAGARPSGFALDAILGRKAFGRYGDEDRWVAPRLRTVATLLHEILPRYTAMPVDLITDGLFIRPNRVFIIPAQRDLHVLDGEFRLKPISKPRGWPDVITVFLRSLTRHWDGKLIAVIVSGYDGDGADALCGIKDVGGITIAQKLETAGQPDMPASAIASGCIDFVLSPEDISREILRIARGEV
jgi:two-component system chemotaxis response regulator CheB